MDTGKSGGGGADLLDKERIFNLLKKIWNSRQQDFSKKFNRTLPFGDYIVDRWHKATTLGFGEGASIYDSALVFGDVKVGKHTWIGPQVILDGTGGLEIGDNCSISAGVQIYSHDTIDWAVSGGEKPYEYAATSIGNNCYIGPNVVIQKGVHIGHECVVGANSFVRQNVLSGRKVAGNPAKIVQ